jgi:hypothetical protein
MQNVVSIDTLKKVSLSQFSGLDWLNPIQRKLVLFVGEALALAGVSLDTELPYDVSVGVADLAHEAEHVLWHEVEKEAHLANKNRREAIEMFDKRWNAIADFFDACSEAGSRYVNFKIEN